MKFGMFVLFLFLSLFMAGCASTSKPVAFNFDRDKGKEAGIDDFIRLRSGELVKGDIGKSKLGFGLINKKASVTMADGTIYKAPEVEEFQIDSTFYKKIPGSQKIFYGRLKSGKINLYYRHFNKSGTDSRGKGYNYSYDEYWLQKGKENPIQKFSLKLLESMVADDISAAALMSEYNAKSSKLRKNQDLDKIVDMYNGKT